MILDNALNHKRPIITANELAARVQSGDKIQVIDARVAKQYENSHVETAKNMPHSSLREEMLQLNQLNH